MVRRYDARLVSAIPSIGNRNGTSQRPRLDHWPYRRCRGSLWSEMETRAAMTQTTANQASDPASVAEQVTVRHVMGQALVGRRVWCRSRLGLDVPAWSLDSTRCPHDSSGGFRLKARFSAVLRSRPPWRFPTACSSSGCGVTIAMAGGLRRGRARARWLDRRRVGGHPRAVVPSPRLHPGRRGVHLARVKIIRAAGAMTCAVSSSYLATRDGRRGT